MFADSLLDVSWAQRSRRSWTTLTSFGLQTLVIGTLLILPLWKTVIVPAAQIVSTPIILGHLEPISVVTHPSGGTTAGPVNSTSVPFVAPGQIPHTVAAGDDGPAPQFPNGSGSGAYVPGVPDGLGKSFPWAISEARPVLPPAPPVAVRPFRPSRLLEGSLIRRVLPEYPLLAKEARIQGPVVLAAIISKSGTIENLQAISGHPMLVRAAVEAVRRWQYRPYILNNEPVEVETQITVNFTLTGN